MALIQCGECSKEISSMAPACPSCGAPNHVTATNAESGIGRGTKIMLWVVGVPVLAIVALLVIGTNISPAEQERQTAGRAIDMCDKQVNDELSSINVRRFARDTCDKMRSDYRLKYGHDY